MCCRDVKYQKKKKKQFHFNESTLSKCLKRMENVSFSNFIFEEDDFFFFGSYVIKLHEDIEHKIK